MTSQEVSSHRSIQSIIHACRCKDNNCGQPSCQKMKRVFDHARHCKIQSKTSCRLCKEIMTVCCYHAKRCQKDRCHIPLCATLKNKLSIEKNNRPRSQQSSGSGHRNSSPQVDNPNSYNSQDAQSSAPISPPRSTESSDTSGSVTNNDENDSISHDLYTDTTVRISSVDIITDLIDISDAHLDDVVQNDDITSYATSFKFTDLHEPDTMTIGNLARAVECVECHEIPIMEIYGCRSGHIICDRCKNVGNYFSCPVCSAPTTDTRNALAEMIVSSMTFKCKNETDGCTQVFSSLDIVHHLKDECPFRPVPCFVKMQSDDDHFGRCKGKLIGFGGYVAHLKDFHGLVESFTPDHQHQQQDTSYPDRHSRFLQCDSVTENVTWPLSCSSFDGNIFFHHVVYQNSLAYFWVSMFGLPAVHKRQHYSASISLVKTSGPEKKVASISATILVQHFRKSFEEIKTERSCIILSKEEFVLLSSTIDPSQVTGDGEKRDDLDDDIVICKYFWTLKTTISKLSQSQVPPAPPQVEV